MASKVISDGASGNVPIKKQAVGMIKTRKTLKYKQQEESNEGVI